MACFVPLTYGTRSNNYSCLFGCKKKYNNTKKEKNMQMYKVIQQWLDGKHYAISLQSTILFIAARGNLMVFWSLAT